MHRDFSVFLDRDGVICNNIDGGHRSIDTIKGIPGSDKALQMLAQLNCNIFIVTNQSWVRRGGVPGCSNHGALADSINDAIIKRIHKIGGRITDLAMCYHTPGDKCECRKPKDGMMWDLATKHQCCWHLWKKSYMIGDAVSDVSAALSARLTPFMVRTGLGQSQYENCYKLQPYLKSIMYNDLLDVVEKEIWPKHVTTPFVPVENARQD